MANWSLPSLTDLYTNFLTYLKARDDDATRMHDSRVTAATNVPDYAKRWNATTQTFQNWLSAAWSSIVLAVAGGGTGATTAAGARTNLDLYSTSEVDALVDAAMTTANSTLTSSVLLSSANTYYDGPSVTLAAGTWFVHAFAYFSSVAATPDDLIRMKLCSSTTVYAGSASNDMLAQGRSMSVSAIITLGAETTIKLSAKCAEAGVVYMYPSAAETNDGTQINAVKIG